jgi:PEP-CTERM motif
MSFRMQPMKWFLQIAATVLTFSLAVSGANADVVTWNFGTSSGQLLNPTGSFAATASGSTSVITPTNGQEAVFTSGGFSIGAFAWCNGGTLSNPCRSKVTQENNYSTRDWNNNTVVETGIGDCNSLCTGGDDNAAIGDTEWLTIALNDPTTAGTSHPDWQLQSITFGDVLASPGEELEFWFSDSAVLLTAETDKIDDTFLQTITAQCVGGIGTQGSCIFDFSALDDPNLNSYDYLYITAVNPNGNDQPAIVLESLTGDFISSGPPGPDTSVPEPATLAVFAAGLAGIAARRRRKAARA